MQKYEIILNVHKFCEHFSKLEKTKQQYFCVLDN